MIVACACDLYVLVCVNFRTNFFLRGKKCKTREKNNNKIK